MDDLTPAKSAYEAWLNSLPDHERGQTGQRGWRRRCAFGACDALASSGLKSTNQNVLQVIGFGSATDIAEDIKAWREERLPQRIELSHLAPLLKSSAVLEAVTRAVEGMASVISQEARNAAEVDLEGERERMAAREAAALQAIAEAEGAAKAAQANEARALSEARVATEAQMAAMEDAAAAKSEAANLAARVAELQAEGEVQRRRMDAMQAETNLTIERLEAASGAYAREVQRLEGAQSFAIQAIESARGDARQLREQLTGVKDELTAVRARLELSFSEGRTSREAAIGERARAETLASELAKCQAKLEEAQHDLAKAGSAEGIASISQQVNIEAGALPVLSELVEVLEGVLLVHSVDGEAAVALFGFEAGRRLTPWLVTTKELEAFVMPWRESLLALESQPGRDLPYRI